ncbi:MAG: hypothetical protein KY460_01700 [Actinobacteria bacterium]|nr:hypothetical protein [Actinomycetota bacterium]
MVTLEQRATDQIMWFSQVDTEDVGLVGGKGANLGELTGAGFPVPDGFVVTAAAYLAAMERGGVRDRLREVAAGVMSPTRTRSPRRLEQRSSWCAAPVRQNSCARRSSPATGSSATTSPSTSPSARRRRARTPPARRSPG